MSRIVFRIEACAAAVFEPRRANARFVLAELSAGTDGAAVAAVVRIGRRVGASAAAAQPVTRAETSAATAIGLVILKADASPGTAFRLLFATAAEREKRGSAATLTRVAALIPALPLAV